jgi:superfamily II DNA or RNA helicase
MRGVKMVKGEYTHKGMVQRVMQCICFADVFDGWRANNPFALPTMLFAPGVPESKWFVQEFEARGVTARHIDGDTPEDEREEILAAHKEGDVKVLSSFGVMREGADLPWVRYGILVQVCGALSTYLQIVGRLLRAFPGKDRCTLQDHSGCWWRHGSPNMDRRWELSQTDKQIAKERRISRQRNEVPEPISCPKCHGIRSAGPKCPHCGYEHQKSVRAVRMTDGSLKRMTGDVIKPKVQPNQDERNWKKCLYAAARSGHTLRQARGRFGKLTGRSLPPDVKPQPAGSDVAWDRRAGEVYPWLLKQRTKAG